MHQVQVPIIPIPDNARFGEMPSICEVVLESMEKGRTPTFPVMLLEVCDTPTWRHEKLPQSASPERMVCIAVDPKSRDAIMAALAEVEKREPASVPRPKVDFTLKGNTPMKQIFRRMADLPITVLSLTAQDDFDATIFFVRTAFTISELQKELPKHTI